MKYRFNGKIKVVRFTDARVSVLLEDTTFLSNEGDWKQWTDWKLVEGGKYKKGEVWVSAFEQSAPEVYQACKIIEKGAEVEVDIFKTEKGFLNINNIQLKVPEVDVNEDLEPPDMPSSEQRPEDSPEAEAEEIVESTTGDIMAEIEATAKDIQIIRQTCVKAIGAMVNLPATNKTTNDLVKIAQRFEKYVLEGK